MVVLCLVSPKRTPMQDFNSFNVRTLWSPLLAPHIKKMETYFALFYFWTFAVCAVHVLQVWCTLIRTGGSCWVQGLQLHPSPIFDRNNSKTFSPERTSTYYLVPINSQLSIVKIKKSLPLKLQLHKGMLGSQCTRVDGRRDGVHVE